MFKQLEWQQFSDVWFATLAPFDRRYGIVQKGDLNNLLSVRINGVEFATAKTVAEAQALAQKHFEKEMERWLK